MGQVVSSPFLTYLAAGLGLLSVVDDDAATSCDQIDRASQSRCAWWQRLRTPTAELAASLDLSVPATGPRCRMTTCPPLFLLSCNP